MTELERLNNDKYFGALYDVEEEQKRMEASAKESGYKDGLQDGREIGVQEGREIGEESKTKELTLKMLDKGIELEEISEITGLSIKKIKELVNK